MKLVFWVSFQLIVSCSAYHFITKEYSSKITFTICDTKFTSVMNSACGRNKPVWTTLFRMFEWNIRLTFIKNWQVLNFSCVKTILLPALRWISRIRCGRHLDRCSKTMTPEAKLEQLRWLCKPQFEFQTCWRCQMYSIAFNKCAMDE